MCGPVGVKRRSVKGKIRWRCRVSYSSAPSTIRAWEVGSKAKRYRRYGLTKQQYEAMIAAQQGLCAICKVRPFAVVDHDHETKEVRGLLCDTCNRGLGLLGDSIERIRAALEYLENARPPGN